MLDLIVRSVVLVTGVLSLLAAVGLVSPTAVPVRTAGVPIMLAESGPANIR